MMLKSSRSLCSVAGPCQRYLHATLLRYDTHNGEAEAVPKNSGVEVVKKAETLFWVPPSLGGVILGKKQSIADEVRKKTKTNSSIKIKVDFNNMKDGEVAVSIKGTTEACARARDALERLSYSVEVKHIETLFWVPSSIAGLIYGKRRAITDQIRKSSKSIWVNIKVDFNKEKDGDVAVSVRGTTEACNKAGETFQMMTDSETTDIMWVPAAECGMIMGNSGATVKRIAKDTSTRVKVDQAAVKDGLVPITIKGLPETCAKARVALKGLEGSVEVKQTETLFWVHESLASAIYANGNTIAAEIRKSTKTNWVNIKVDFNRSNDQDLAVCVRGTAKACIQAGEIFERMNDPATTDTMWVPANECGMIMGYSGATVKSIARETKTRIKVDQAAVNEGLVPIAIKGRFLPRINAREAIKRLQASKTSDTMWLSATDCGIVLGKSGLNIRKIVSDTNSHIEIDYTAVKGGKIPVTIQGQPEGCMLARKIIKGMIGDSGIERHYSVPVIPSVFKDKLVGKEEAGNTIEGVVESASILWIPVEKAFGKKSYLITVVFDAAQDSGIRIDIGKTLTSDGYINATITANDLDQIAVARDMLIDIVGPEYRIDCDHSQKIKLQDDFHKLWCLDDLGLGTDVVAVDSFDFWDNNDQF